MRDMDFAGDPATALLILSELVTNAVTHGIAPIELMVSDTDGALRIEVSDGDTHIPRPASQNPNTDHVGGRGLRIVDSLADLWGTMTDDFGKTVWAEVRA